MAAMTKRERVWAAVHGGTVDRPPFFFWHHFKPRNVPHQLAQSTLDFFGRFDLDVYKIMPDMPYPFPQNSIRESDDWDLIAPLEPDASNLGRMVQTTSMASAKWHATGCPWPRSTSSGSSSAQML